MYHRMCIAYVRPIVVHHRVLHTGMDHIYISQGVSCRHQLSCIKGCIMQTPVSHVSQGVSCRHQSVMYHRVYHADTSQSCITQTQVSHVSQGVSPTEITSDITSVYKYLHESKTRHDFHEDCHIRVRHNALLTHHIKEGVVGLVRVEFGIDGEQQFS